MKKKRFLCVCYISFSSQFLILMKSFLSDNKSVYLVGFCIIKLDEISGFQETEKHPSIADEDFIKKKETKFLSPIVKHVRNGFVIWKFILLSSFETRHCTFHRRPWQSKVESLPNKPVSKNVHRIKHSLDVKIISLCYNYIISLP